MPGPPSRLLAATLRVEGALSRAVLRVVRFVTLPLPAGILLLGLLSTFIGIGLAGLDFGGHWDEWYHVVGVQGCVNRLSLMPEPLSYGGPYFTLGFPVVLADQWRNVLGMLHDLRTLPRGRPGSGQAAATAAHHQHVCASRNCVHDRLFYRRHPNPTNKRCLCWDPRAEPARGSHHVTR